MEYLETSLSRANEDELKEALQVKLDDGWEISLDITPIYKSGVLRQKGTYTVTKYMCRVRKEASLAKVGRKIANK